MFSPMVFPASNPSHKCQANAQTQGSEQKPRPRVAPNDQWADDMGNIYNAGPPFDSYRLVYNSNVTMVYGTYNYGIHGVNLNQQRSVVL